MSGDARFWGAGVCLGAACAAAVGALACVAGGCKVVEPVTQIGTEIAVQTGTISRREAESINRTTGAMVKTFEDITPEQEYYIGRSVAATLLGMYRPFSGEDATRYVNVLGQTLGAASDRPETFGGYHFLVLDTPEVNAFAAPGGLILVTRGMIRLCGTEDAFAAVLAHEIAHVQGKDGLRAIKRGRLTKALTILAAESAKTFGGADLAELTEAFEGTVGDITGTLVNNGYSRDLEREADRNAVAILARVGYDPRALVDMLEAMKKTWRPGGPGFVKTHPDPADRIADLRALVAGSAAAVQAPEARQARFTAALAGI